jgi:hypothetical protein
MTGTKRRSEQIGKMKSVVAGRIERGTGGAEPRVMVNVRVRKKPGRASILS